MPEFSRIDSGVAIGNRVFVYSRWNDLKVERPTPGVKGDRIVVSCGGGYCQGANQRPVFSCLSYG